MNPREIELLEAVRAWLAYFEPQDRVSHAASMVRDGFQRRARLEAAVRAYDIFTDEDRRQEHEAHVLGKVAHLVRF